MKSTDAPSHYLSTYANANGTTCWQLQAPGMPLFPATFDLSEALRRTEAFLRMLREAECLRLFQHRWQYTGTGRGNNIYRVPVYDGDRDSWNTPEGLPAFVEITIPAV